jgi:hypothetical protein
MKTIKTELDMKMAIRQLENDQVLEWVLLREELHTTAKNISPIGLAAGYLSKALIIGRSHSPLKNLLGSVIQLGITRIVSKLRDE